MDMDRTWAHVLSLTPPLADVIHFMLISLIKCLMNEQLANVCQVFSIGYFIHQILCSCIMYYNRLINSDKKGYAVINLDL